MSFTSCGRRKLSESQSLTDLIALSVISVSTSLKLLGRDLVVLDVEGSFFRLKTVLITLPFEGVTGLLFGVLSFLIIGLVGESRICAELLERLPCCNKKDKSGSE